VRVASVAIGILIGGIAAAPALACPAPAIAAGDAAWERRADGAGDDGRAASLPVGAAITAWEAALAEDPDCLATYAKLLHALYFAGDLASGDAADKRMRFDRAEEIVAVAMAAIGRRLGGAAGPRAAFDVERLRSVLPGEAQRDVARIHFWSAVDLAAWARERGLITAVRAGVAARIRDHAVVTLALEPAYEAGGAHRVLAALHGELPRVPLLTPWVQPELALPEIERAVSVAPDHPGNRLMLGLVLLDREPARRAEALALLEGVASLDPAPSRRVEDAALRAAARTRLEKERPSSQ
jgi:tetratricopeptide (TPR) repeat protein